MLEVQAMLEGQAMQEVQAMLEGQVRQEQMQPMTRMLMKRGRCPHVPSEGDRTVASSVVDKNIFAHVLKKRSDNS